MANYYGFNSGANPQQFGLGNPASYNSSAYTMQQQQTGASQFMSPASQPVQQQTAYMTYAHVGNRAVTAGSSQSYQSSYSYGTSGPSTPQQTSFAKPATQPQQYFPAGNSGWASSSSNTVNIKTQQQAQQPRTTLYANNGSSGYNQAVGNVVTPQQQVTMSATSAQGLQDAPAIAYVQGKPAAASGNNKANYSQQPPIQAQSVSNYEKALISAANSIYSQQHKGGGGGGQQSIKNLPYWKQKRIEAQQNRDPNKPIVASEVKAYLYAWLAKERTRPEYNITAHGVSPYRQTYVCEIVAPGYSYVGKGSAGNKKDSQTRAAWDFCDFLVREGKMKESDLPMRESKFQASNNKLPAGYKKRSDSEILSAATKKKVTSNKINFVGGSTLHLSDSTECNVEIGPVAYPQLTTTVNEKPVAVVVDLKPDKQVSVKTLPVSQADGGEAAALKNEPIGEDYVDQVWTDGRVIRYRCKLCECEFNDPSARELHIRGRRHKLSYKKKVDPSLEVDVKLNPKQKNMMMMKLRQEARKEAAREQRRKQQQWKLEMQKQEVEQMRLHEEELYYKYQEEMIQFEETFEFHRRRNLQLPQHIRPPIRPLLHLFRPATLPQFQQRKSCDDQHVMTKHSQIYPTEEELNSVQSAVQTVEGTLKEISNTIHEQEMKVFTASNLNGKRPQPERLLKAVLRIGDLAKGLLLHGHLKAELILMCNQKPSKTLLNRVTDNMPKRLVDGSEMKMRICVEDCGFVLATTSQPQVTIPVILTATQMRPIEATGATKGSSKPDPPDILDREKCCMALAALRHSKWFQAKATGLQSCVLVTRIMKDLCVRVPTWSPLSNWAVELLVERVIASAKIALSPSVALLRVFEALACGVLLPGGPGILDPCERQPTDAAVALTKQEREDITASAQHALRLLSFKKIHKVLSMEALSENQVSLKRQQDVDDQGFCVQTKKIKAE